MQGMRTCLIVLGLVIAANAHANGQQMPWPNVSSYSSNKKESSAKEAISTAKRMGASYLSSQIKSRLSNWLSRTDIDYAIQEKNKPVGSVETIQPLYFNDWHTVFWQGRLAYSNKSTTANLGLGYRYLTNDKHWMWGVNTFYDENVRFLHRRLGIGGELFTSYLTFRANYYDALSGQKKVGANTYERALDGFDASIETPVPYFSWMRFTAQGYHWQGVQASNVNGGLGNLRVFFTRQLEVDVGVAYDNSQHTQGFLEANFYLGAPTFIEHNALASSRDRRFTPQNLENMRLQKVIRHNDIVVEKTRGTSDSGIVIARGT